MVCISYVMLRINGVGGFFGSAVPVSEPSKTETPEALVTRAIVGFYHPSKSTPKLHLTTALTTDSEIFRNWKSKYPGVAQLVARVVWDHQAAGSNPVTRTKNPLKSLISADFVHLLFIFCKLLR